MSEFVIKGPGRYRTRHGQTAYVVNTASYNSRVWQGVLLGGFESWFLNGQWNPNGTETESALDLVEYLGPIDGEEPKPDANKERRERIATAVLSGIYAAQPMPDYADEPVNKIERRDRVEEAILAADALIAELNKE